MDLKATERKYTDVTANEKKRIEWQILKPADDNKKKQKLLESSFFCAPAATLTDVETVEMIVAQDLETEQGRSAAARIDVDYRDSAHAK